MFFKSAPKKRPQRGAFALRPLQFRRPTGDLGGGPIGASPSTGKTQYGLIEAARAERVPAIVAYFEPASGPKETAPARGKLRPQGAFAFRTWVRRAAGAGTSENRSPTQWPTLVA